MCYHQKLQQDMNMMLPLRMLDVAVVVMALLSCVSVPLTLVQAQPGFISIDCGLSAAAYTDANNITWVPDTGYTFTGQNFDLVTSDKKTLQSLRYFPEGRSKDCYVLPAIQNSTYMVRAYFLYNDFPDTGAPPTFDLEIEALSVAQIGFTSSAGYSIQQYCEAYLSATKDTIYVCLARITGDPFISSLELRPLDTASMYKIVQQGSYLLNQFHASIGGSTPVIRYPYDVYDRQWQTDVLQVNPISSFAINTTTPVNVLGPWDRVPELVMQSAESWPRGEAVNLTLPYPMFNNSNYYVAFYFAEIDPLAHNQTRVFDMVVNQGPSEVTDRNISVVSVAGGMYIAIELAGTNATFNSGSGSIQLIPHADSQLGPILNALELFVLTPPVPNLTFVSDAFAIESVKEAFNLTSWLGDPCAHTPYDWITCTNDTIPRVEALKLSNYNLTGTIPAAALSNLTALTQLWLDHNSLEGPIPDLSALKNLQSIQLQNNNITGEIPVWLASLPSLQELLLSNNNLSGTIPSALLNNKNLTLGYFGNPILCNATGRCLSPPSPSPISNSTLHKANVPAIVGGVVGGLFVAAGFTLVLIYAFFYKRPTTSRGGGSVLGKGHEHPGGPNVAQEYSLAEVTAMTNNFKQTLGVGSFGTVCYGKLPDGQEVAVKRASPDSHQGAKEFYNEVDLLSRVHHKNLVALVGYCQEGKEQILIYEYMPCGTVREALYGTSKAHNNPLSWRARLDIALNAAEGLEYLHTSCVPSIIHRDVKTSNILLSANMTAKVADFGLSKVVNENVSHVSTVVKGTIGYLDPEYYTRQILTDKSDVFSFGIVLLELICGRQSIDTTLCDQMEWNIGEWVKPHLEAGAINNIIDKAMGDNYKLETIWKVAEIAVMSIQPFGVNRPTMRQVVSDLREAIAMETSMQSYDGSSISMQSDPSSAPTIASPTATTMARNNNNNHHIPGSSPHVGYMCSPSETDKLQTNIPSSSSPDIMGIPSAR
ncbi:hypothetical protein CY35_12G015600 [Sphagnum magellanicum]|nr:hypothetical protein CY35_12G015600 [Sphagnum magellanicum]